MTTAMPPNNQAIQSYWQTLLLQELHACNYYLWKRSSCSWCK